MAEVIGFEKIYKTRYKVTCGKCGAIILFDEKEVRNEYQYNEYAFSTAECPNCGERLSFDKHKVKTTKEQVNVRG